MDEENGLVIGVLFTLITGVASFVVSRLDLWNRGQSVQIKEKESAIERDGAIMELFSEVNAEYRDMSRKTNDLSSMNGSLMAENSALKQKNERLEKENESLGRLKDQYSEALNTCRETLAQVRTESESKDSLINELQGIELEISGSDTKTGKYKIAKVMGKGSKSEWVIFPTDSRKKATIEITDGDDKQPETPDEPPASGETSTTPDDSDV